MPLIDWPEELPWCFLIAGQSERFGDGRLRVPMDAGPEKVRRRFSAAVRPMAGRMRLTITQVARLEQFWDEDTEDGVLPFLFPDQRRHNRRLLDGNGDPVLDGNGDPVLASVYHLVRFNESPALDDRINRDVYIVGLSFIVLPRVPV